MSPADNADKGYPEWVRHAGMGLELAGAVAGLSLIGYWIDSRYHTQPWGLVVGLVMGLGGGMYTFVKQSLEAAREAREEDTHES